MSDRPILHDYWRSSASYRLRIALNVLGLPYDTHPVDLLGGAHRTADHLALNPQGLLPVLQIDGQTLTQSLAILEYLHATREGSTLLPASVTGQARVRQLSYAIAMEIHPVCNLAVAAHVAELTQGGAEARADWMRHFISRGLSAFDALLSQTPDSGPFCYADQPTMADCCLIPQLYNADRWGVSWQDMPHVARAAEAAYALEAVQLAHPDRVGPPDKALAG